MGQYGKRCAMAGNFNWQPKQQCRTSLQANLLRASGWVPVPGRKRMKPDEAGPEQAALDSFISRHCMSKWNIGWRHVINFKIFYYALQQKCGQVGRGQANALPPKWFARLPARLSCVSSPHIHAHTHKHIYPQKRTHSRALVVPAYTSSGSSVWRES